MKARGRKGPRARRGQREPVVRIASRLVRPYRRAWQMLRAEMGTRAPALPELIAHEFSGRTVAMVVEEYMENPVTPRLRRDDVQIAWGRRQVEG